MSRIATWWESPPVVRVRLSVALLTERRAGLFIALDLFFLFAGLMIGLSGNGFAVVPTNINPQSPAGLANDWAWNDAYTRCVVQHDQPSIAWLKAHIMAEAERSVRASSSLAKLLFGHDIAHILLIHVGAFDALMLDSILKDFRARGVTFVTLDEDHTFAFISRVKGGGVSAWTGADDGEFGFHGERSIRLAE